jgi:hypothetical protein
VPKTEGLEKVMVDWFAMTKTLSNNRLTSFETAGIDGWLLSRKILRNETGEGKTLLLLYLFP